MAKGKAILMMPLANLLILNKLLILVYFVDYSEISTYLFALEPEKNRSGSCNFWIFITF